MSATRILGAAREIFAEKGYEGTSLSEIAEKVGIKKPSIYAHYVSKEELFFVVIDQEIQRFSNHLDHVYSKIKDYSSREALFVFFKELIEFAVKDPCSRILFSGIMYFPMPHLVDKIRPRMGVLNQKALNIQLGVFSKGLENGEIRELDIEELIYSYSAFIQGNFAMLLYSDIFTMERLLYCWDMYWRGIAKDI